MTMQEDMQRGELKREEFTQEELMAQIEAHVEHRRMISREVTEFLREVNAEEKCSTENPTFLRKERISILVNPEQQAGGAFRIAISLHPLPPHSFDLGFIRLGLLTESGQRISGRNRTAERRGDDYSLGRRDSLHILFENVPAGKFTLENWSFGGR